MKLSILIVNWNSKEYLRDCLKSIRATCAMHPLQIVVVDGGSFDGSEDMLQQEFPEVEFVQSGENIGFGRSNNLGFEHVRGEALLLLNPDTELRPGAVNEMLRCLRDLPAAGMVGAKQLNTDGSLQVTSVHNLPTPFNAALDSSLIRRRWWDRNRERIEAGPIEVEAVSGACMMIRSATFREIAGFNPRFFIYAEDMDLCFRIQKAGLRIYHTHQAEVVHHGGGSSRTCFRKMPVILLRDALYLYFEINHGLFQALLYRAMMASSAAIRLPFLAVVWFLNLGGARQEKGLSLHKWWVILRWALGFESQTRRDVSTGPRVDPVSLAAPKQSGSHLSKNP